MTNHRIAYLGPDGTFTHEAALKYFKENGDFQHCEKIVDVFNRVLDNQADFGVVPAENSIGGSIADTLDLFINTDLKIYDQESLEIRQNLMASIPREKIRRIYSHPSVFFQCNEYLRKNFPSAEYIESSSTSKAAVTAASDPEGAAIGSLLSARTYGLSVLEEYVNDYKHNETKFFIISRQIQPGHRKHTLIIFAVPDRPGSLFEVLKVFKEENVNMTRIESRPSRIKKWHYVFIIEYENPSLPDENQKLLGKLSSICDFLKNLGSY